MRTWIKRLWKDQRGQDMIEYALLAAAVAVTSRDICRPQSCRP